MCIHRDKETNICKKYKAAGHPVECETPEKDFDDCFIRKSMPSGKNIDDNKEG